MRFNREIIGIGILLLLFIGAAAVMSGRNEGKSRVVGKEAVPDPSIYNDRASGSKGLYDFVGRLGYTPAVWRRRWSALDKSNGSILFAVAPKIAGATQLTGNTPFGSGDDDDQDDADTASIFLQPSDATALKSWLRPGRTAVIMTSSLPGGSQGGNADSFADALGISVEAPNAGTAISEFAAVQPTPLADGVLSLRISPGARIHSKLPDLTGLVGDKNGPVVAVLPVGKGRLIVVADGAFASNYNLGLSENAVFLANVLSRYARPGDNVLFDEYHHGDADLEGGSSLWNALGRPLQLAIVQVVLAILVAFAVASTRFGTAIPLIRAGSRTSAEYVTSLATLYWKAGASTTALEMIYRQFLRETTSRLGLSADVSLEQLADAAARRGGVSVMEMRRLLALCEQHIDTGKVSEAELLDLVRRMDRIRKEIGIA
jgi:hypothetical protein